MPGNWWIAVGSSCPLILFVRIRISDNTVNQKGEKIRWISIHAILSYLKERKKKKKKKKKVEMIHHCYSNYSS